MTQTPMDSERRMRALHALLMPAVRLARELDLPLADLKRAAEMAYFDEATRRVELLKDLRRVMSISISKVGLLSRTWRTWFIPDDGMALKRRVEYMLASGPLTLARLNQVLPQERFVDLEGSLRELLAEGRIEKIEQQATWAYGLVFGVADTHWSRMLERISGLERVGDAWYELVRSQLLEGASEADSSRWTLPMRREDVAEITKLVEALGERLNELSCEPRDADMTLEVGVLLAPQARTPEE